MVLVLVPAAAVLVYLSPRPFTELPPWLPLFLATGLLLSVSVVPWARRSLESGHGHEHENGHIPTLEEFLRENEPFRVEGTQAGTNGQDSIHSVGTLNDREAISFFRRIRSSDLAHIGLFGNAYQPGSSRDGSDIDLEEGFIRNIALSEGSVGSQDQPT